MASRFAIGDFSRATLLSVKTLRHYHAVGLLEPSEVDADNGYRYYSEKQIPLAQVIRRLRNLEMPVAEVKAVLSAPDVAMRNRLISDHLARVEAELAKTASVVADLRDLLTDHETAPHVEHRTLPAARAIAVQETIGQDELGAWWRGALGELNATIDAQGLARTGPSAGLYDSEIFNHGRGTATVFIPVEGDTAAVGRVVSTLIPAAELAIIRHSGTHRNIDLTYGELGAYVMRHEIAIAGPVREYYIRAFLETPNLDEWETEIGWPIFRRDPPR